MNGSPGKGPGHDPEGRACGPPGGTGWEASSRAPPFYPRHQVCYGRTRRASACRALSGRSGRRGASRGSAGQHDRRVTQRTHTPERAAVPRGSPGRPDRRASGARPAARPDRRPVAWRDSLECRVAGCVASPGGLCGPDAPLAPSRAEVSVNGRERRSIAIWEGSAWR